MTTPGEGRAAELGRDDLDDLYCLLDAVREDGTVNLYGAGPVLVRLVAEGGGKPLTRREARKILTAWMQDHNREGRKDGS